MDILPAELCLKIFRWLDHENLASAQQVCQKWKTLGGEDVLWLNLFKERWGEDQAAFYAPVDSKSWKEVYEVQDRCDRVGLGLKIIREGGNYYLVHQGEIQRYLGSRQREGGSCSSPDSKSNFIDDYESPKENESGRGLLDKILFFIGDLEVASTDSKRTRILLKVRPYNLAHFLIILLNFWLRLTEEMQELISNENSVETLRFDPECLSSCLKVLMKLVMEDAVSPSQGLGTLVGYLSCGLKDDQPVEFLTFCRAMVFAGCGFGVLSVVFSETMSHSPISSTVDGVSYDLPLLYINILDPILKDLASGSDELHKLYHLLSSLSKLEGEMENLQGVRCVVWERMVQFSHDLQLPSHVRVHALELMQFISGRNLKNFSPELQSNLSPWEGWDESLATGTNSKTIENIGLLERAGTSSKLDSTLVALKSSQIAAAISPAIEITPSDLLNVGTAVSCFFKLCEASSTNAHFDALISILEEWEGFFVLGKEKEGSAETPESGNNWNNDDWDEGWESFQDEEPPEIEKVENSQTHPLHECWLEIFKKLVLSSRFDDVLKLIDQSLSKTNGVLLDEDDARSLNQAVNEMNFLVALKIALLLPYEGLRLQCLSVMEDKLKQGGALDTIGDDHEFLVLVLSSGFISTIIMNSSFGTIFPYLCYLVGDFSRRCQEVQLSSYTQRGNNERISTNDSLLLFRKILLPCIISELVKADQHILAGFIVTKFMHTNLSLSLINVSEANLSRYLKTQLNTLHCGEIAQEEIESCKTLENTISRLKDKMENLIKSASALLSTNVR